MRTLILTLSLLSGVAHPAVAAEARPGSDPPRVLVLVAHPDDETTFAGALYKLTHALGAVVDLAVVTNGEGGFRYATLAEPIYGERLAEQAAARAHLPRIRKRELMAGGAILGLRDFFFLDQPDGGVTSDAGEARRHWDVPLVEKRLAKILARGRYGFVFTLLPTAATHGAHQAAALLALQAVSALPAGARPVLLGGIDLAPGEAWPADAGLAGRPLTAPRGDGTPFVFDRGERFGYGARLDYHIVVNWVIAEHKSQGLLQAGMNRADRELYFAFDTNAPAAVAAAGELFARLAPAPPAPVDELLWPERWSPPRQGVCPIPR